MNKSNIDKALLERYFCYGIENKKELENGLLYYVASKIHKESSIHDTIKEFQRDDKTIKAKNVQKLIEEAILLYRQYYRFIVLPDSKENYSMDITEENMIQIKQNIQERIDELQKDEKLNIYILGVYFSLQQEEIYKEKWELEDMKTYKMRHYKNWTQDVYEVLIKLKELEEEDAQRYQEQWINIRLSRAENRVPKDEVEVSNIEKIKEIFEKKKDEYNRKEEKER